MSVPTATRFAVYRRCMRDGVLCCEVCGVPLLGEPGFDWALHHRKGRTNRPDVHNVENLLAVHGADNVTACHGRVHTNREGESRDNGWWIHRNGIVQPLTEPVLIDNGSRHVYLLADGSYGDNPETP